MRARPRVARRRRFTVATALLALVASAYCGLFAANSLIRVRTFTADSMNYVDVARRVTAGDGLVQSAGGFNQPFYLSGDLDLPSVFTAQPPGYPLAIALLSWFGMDAADAALVVSALAYAAILALVWLLGRRIGGSTAGAVAVGAALLFAPLTHLGRAALSESLAVGGVLLFFLLLDRRLEGERGGAWAASADRDAAVRRSSAPPDPTRGGAPAASADGDRSTPVWRLLLAAFGLGLLAGLAFGLRYSLWPLPLVGVAAFWICGGVRPGQETGSEQEGPGSGARPGPCRAADPARNAPAGLKVLRVVWPLRWRSGAAIVARLVVPLTFGVGALAPMTWILVRNQLAAGHFLPSAMPSVTTLPESLGRAIAAVFGGWRSTALGNWSDAATLAVVLVLLGVLATRAGRQARSQPGRLPVLVLLWTVLYLAAVVWRSTQANFDPIGVRLALPVTVPMIPVFGALVAAALPGLVRRPWLPAAILVACFGAAFVRESTLWSTGRDARTVAFQSERHQWLREHTVPGDFVIGGGTMDVPFLFPGRQAISYAGLPYTEVLTYADLERIADRHCPDFDRLLLLVRPTVQLGGGRSDEDPGDWLGPFIADARAGRHEAYALLEPLAALDETRAYRVNCP